MGNEEITYQKLDEFAMNFLKNYFLKLSYTHGKFWDYTINQMIQKYINPFFTVYENNATIPVEFSVATIPQLENSQYIPPACIWILEQHRCSVHDLYYILGFQYYVIWDIYRKEIFPMGFHDLIAFDCAHDLLYGRLHPGVFNDLYNVFSIDSKWIELEENIQYKKSIEYIDSLEIDDKFIVNGINSFKKDKYDLSNVYQCPDLDSVVNKNLIILSGNNKHSDKLQALENIMYHPYFSYNEILEFFENNALVDLQTRKTIKNLIEEINENKDDLPF